MSKQLEWDVYRYVLDDPTLDRTAFEALMLEDMNLALAVADAVSHIDSLRAASFIAPVSVAAAQLPASTGGSAAEGGWHLSSLAALAAAFLLAIGLVNFQVSTKRHVAHDSVKKTLAENWLAMLNTEIVDVSSNLVDVSTNLEAAHGEDVLPEPSVFVATESLADDDWLMDAAREFYAQGANAQGGAG